MGGHPLLILTTTGRRTGRPFSTPVIGIADGDDYLVVASNGGAATQPIWVRNIATNPRVTISRDTLTQEREARFLTPAERTQRWPRLVEAYKPYATMQARTDRELPVLRLSPIHARQLPDNGRLQS
jgi:deazaflavin-dependent oxidoreductase (nitroreductase family)